ncbi:hypothetical protein AAG570_009254 [Ranatra chinensis]|uniref:Chitin-binding type-2 domain-containing protein n=1 Tax=Ranatra chinensis TaxID=642074 RepID=A0ABD0YTJ6_9HEMI
MSVFPAYQSSPKGIPHPWGKFQVALLPPPQCFITQACGYNEHTGTVMLFTGATILLSLAVTTSPAEVGCTKGAKFRKPGHCAEYLECIGGQLQNRKCERSEWFDEVRGVCLPMSGATGCPPACTGNERWPAGEEDCTLYVACNSVTGQRVTRTCPAGEYFSGLRGMCLPGDKLSCLDTCYWTVPRVPLRDNCTSYLECVNNRVRKRFCAPGEALHEASLECRPVAEADCRREEPECEEGRKRHNPYNCYGYEKCEGGKFRKKYCPGGRMFDRILEKCEYRPPGYDCSMAERCSQEGKKLPATGTIAEYRICEGGSLVKMKCPDGKSFDESTGECELTPVCRSHERKSLGACGYQYWDCNGGVFRKKSCLLGRYFDETEGICVRALPAGCQVCTAGDVRPVPGFWRDYERCVGGRGWVRESCGAMHRFDTENNHCVFDPRARPSLCQPGRKTAVEGSCTDYRQCGQSGEFGDVETCRHSGKVFDRTTEGCRWRSLGDCKVGQGTEIGACRQGKTKPSDDGNLAEYGECDNGIWKRTACPPGTLYHAGTCREVKGVDSPRWSAPKDGSCRGGSRRPVGGRCHLYDECLSQGLRVRRSCPPGLRYDTVTEVCVAYSKARCQPALCSGYQRSPDLHDCSVYYECDSGAYITLKCPTLQGFDYVKKQCVFRFLARCAKKPIL